MSFSEEAGYLPTTFEALMNFAREGINEQFSTSFTEESFVGTGWYRYLYTLIQSLQESEVKTSEIFSKLQEYITVTNERISRPLVTGPGLFDEFTRNGFVISIKAPIEADRGKLYVCVDTDEMDEDYAEVKLNICTILKNCTSGGIVTFGTETESLALTNGQSFDYKFSLPNRIPVLLRLTTVLSVNNTVEVGSALSTREKLLANALARYRVGLDFEPQKYFAIEDAPWASSVLLEWSDDAGENWSEAVFTAEFDDKYEFDLGDISLIET